MTSFDRMEDAGLEVSFLEGGSSALSPMKIQLKAPPYAFGSSPNLASVFRPPPGLENEKLPAPPPGLENRQHYFPPVKATVPADAPPGIFAARKAGPPGCFLPRLQQSAYSLAHQRTLPPLAHQLTVHSCSSSQAAPHTSDLQDSATQRKAACRSLPKVRNGKRHCGPALIDGTDNASLKCKEILSSIKCSGAASTLSLQEAMPHVLELARDKDGVQFLLARLDDSPEDVKSVCQAVLTETCKLSADPSGSLLIRKLFEVAAVEQRWALAVHLQGNVKQLTCDVHGCRVVQAALQHVSPDLQAQLAEGLQESIVHCMKSIHGNHVVQMVIEQLKPESLEFIVDAVIAWGAEKASVHPYVCRVVMRLLEHCEKLQQVKGMCDTLIRNVCTLAKDRYGNYVVQHILEHGSMQDKQTIVTGCIQGGLLELAKHKYAHNVVEKCLELEEVDRDSIVRALLSSPVEDLVTSRFGAMVAQHLLDVRMELPCKLLVQKLAAAESRIADNEFAAPLLQAIQNGNDMNELS